MRKYWFILLFSFNLSFASNLPQIGAEIWIESGQTPQQIDNWFKIMADMDMPVVRLFMQWNFMQSDTNSWDFTLFDQAFRSAEKYKVKVVATLIPNKPPYFYGPEYWYSNQGSQILKTHTEMNRAANYISVIVNRYKTSSALDTWMLMNEPGQPPTPDSIAIERFQIWLKEKYVDIKKLNENWLTGFKSFDSIQYNSAWIDGGWTWPSATIDWYSFWRTHLTWSLKWIADEIRKNDSQHSLHVNPHALFDYLPYYELPEWSNLLTSMGASVHPSWHFYLHPRNKYAEALCFINDMIRGAAEPKPYWITELQGGNNLYSSTFPLCPTKDDLAQWLWTSVGSGAERVIYWCLNAKVQGTEAAEWGLLNFDDKPSERLLVSSQIAKTIHVNEKLFNGAKPVQSGITILLSPQTMVLEERIKSSNGKPGTNSGAHLKAALAYYHALSDLGIPVEIKFIDHFDWSNNKQKRVIILPHAFALTEQQIKKIDAFVYSGNKVIATGLTGLFDENNKSWMINRKFPLEPVFGGSVKDIRFLNDRFDFNMEYYQLMLPAHLWQTEINNKTGKVIALQDDKILAVKNKYGKGEAVWAPSLIDVGAYLYAGDGFKFFIQNETSDLFNKLIFTFDSPQNDVILRVLENNGKYVAIIVNQQPKIVQFTLQTKITLKPKVIYGDEYAFNINDHSIKLGANQSLVIVWE